MLDQDYVPLDGIDGGGPRPPLHPSRYRAFIYGCAQVAHEDAITLAGGKVARPKPTVKQKARGSK